MTPQGRPLTGLHRVAITAAVLPMLAVGIAGASGTYTNMRRAFPGPTALGVVAAGEGATLVLAILLAVLTAFGQSYPLAARVGLWALPVTAAVTGVTVANTTAERVVYAVTPLAMSVSGEGLGFMVRRVVVYRTGVDAEQLRRNAQTMQRLAYQRAAATYHPIWLVRRLSDLRSWRLARKVGVGDLGLGASLVTVQRERMTAGADTALAAMFGTPVTPVTPEIEATVTPALPAVTATPVTPVPDVTDGSVTPAVTPVVTAAARRVTPTVTGTVTQVSAVTEPVTTEPVTPVTPVDEKPATSVTPPVTGPVTIAEIAAVTGVTVPQPGVQLADEQLTVVLRWLRYQTDPPRSYRQAAAAFRDAGFVGGERRVRAAFAQLLLAEETTAGGQQ